MLMVVVLGEYTVADREGGRDTLTRLGQWMSTNDGTVSYT